MFLKKKKLIEIDNKINSVLEQVGISNQRQEDILSFFNRIEKQLDSIEERIADNHSVVSQSVKETETSIVKEIAILRDDISKAHRESIVTLGESISYSRELLQQLIADDGKTSRDKMGTMTHELDNKLDMMDSSLRLLLLNSIMDQIEE